EATSSGEPDAGNLHVRFDEGRGTAKVPSYSTGSESVFYVSRLRLTRSATPTRGISTSTANRLLTRGSESVFYVSTIAAATVGYTYQGYQH
ncbi:MAG TPA: hypothetical protein VKG25_04050, partial [Bryobacteraceae bacterium]|nr:hypothetical protein [Bryobacteraceae bacterium]